MLPSSPRDNYPLGLFRYTKSSATAGLFVFCIAVQFVKNPAVLFTFWGFYDIITLVRYLIDKLEFDGGVFS